MPRGRPSTLKDILVKPTVAGLVKKDGELADAPWPAILERDVWERLTGKLTDPARRTNPSTANEPRWLVSKFARCGSCGDTMHVTGGGQRPAVYTGDECNHVSRSARLLDGYIAGLVVGRLGEPDGGDLLRPPPRPGVDVAGLLAKRDRLRARRRHLNERAVDDDLDDEDVAVQVRRIKKRLDEIDVQLAASDETDPLDEFRHGDPAAGVWESLSMARRRAVVQTLIGNITVLPVTRKGRYPFDPDRIEGHAPGRRALAGVAPVNWPPFPLTTVISQM